MENDAETIANYSDPTYVVAGWTPELAPIVLTQLPASVEVPVGGSVELVADAAAEPEATYQWHKDGQPLAGETSATLKLQQAAACEYTASITNRLGTIMARTNVVAGGATTAMPPSAGAAGSTTQAGAAGSAANGGTPASAGAGAGAAPATNGAATQVPSTNNVPPPAGGTTAPASTPPAQGGNSATDASPAASGGCSVGPSGDLANAYPWLIVGLLVHARRRRTVLRQH